MREKINNAARRVLAISVLGLGSLAVQQAHANTDDINRQPGCLREQLFMQDVLAEIVTTGKPVGQKIMGPGTSQPLSDPNFGYEWNKYQTSRIDREFITEGRSVTRYVIVIHYMYNYWTGEIAQVKLKNTLDSGCRGDMSRVGSTGSSISPLGLAPSVNLALSGSWVNTYVWDHYYNTITFVDRVFEPSGNPTTWTEPPPLYYQQVAM